MPAAEAVPAGGVTFLVCVSFSNHNFESRRARRRAPTVPPSAGGGPSLTNQRRASSTGGPNITRLSRNRWP